MKRFKTVLTIALGVALLAAATVSLAGCSSEVSPVNFSADNGYTVDFVQSESSFTINAPGGIAIGTIAPSGVWNTNDKGETKYIGIRKDENFIELNVRLKLEYDPAALTVTVNGNAAVNKGASAYLMPRADGGELFTSIRYRYEATDSEKSFNVQIGGIKTLTIGGHKWKLHGIVSTEAIHIYGDYFENLKVGTDIDYRFDFKTDKTVYTTFKYDATSSTGEGTWSEESGVLSTDLTIDEKSVSITMTIMTAAQRKELITDIENRGALSEENKAVGMGVLWDRGGDLQFILVLDL